MLVAGEEGSEICSSFEFLSMNIRLLWMCEEITYTLNYKISGDMEYQRNRDIRKSDIFRTTGLTALIQINGQPRRKESTIHLEYYRLLAWNLLGN